MVEYSISACSNPNRFQIFVNGDGNRTTNSLYVSQASGALNQGRTILPLQSGDVLTLVNTDNDDVIIQGPGISASVLLIKLSNL